MTNRTFKHDSRFAMGDMAKEKISGVEGRVVGISFWETGCTHIGIKRLGLDKEQKPFDILWFDEPMVDHVVADAQPEKAPNASKKPGGPLTSGMSYAR